MSIGILPVINCILVPVLCNENAFMIDKKVIQFIVYPEDFIPFKIKRFQDAKTGDKYIIIILPLIENVIHRCAELRKTVK